MAIPKIFFPGFFHQSLQSEEISPDYYDVWLFGKTFQWSQKKASYREPKPGGKAKLKRLLRLLQTQNNRGPAANLDGTGQQPEHLTFPGKAHCIAVRYASVNGKA